MLYEPDKKVLEITRKLNRLPKLHEWAGLNGIVIPDTKSLPHYVKEYENYLNSQLKADASGQVKKCPHCGGAIEG